MKKTTLLLVALLPLLAVTAQKENKTMEKDGNSLLLRSEKTSLYSCMLIMRRDTPSRFEKAIIISSNISDRSVRNRGNVIAIV